MGGLLHHQAGEFQLDVGGREGVGDGLVGADGLLPHLAGLRVVDGLGEGVAAHADGERGGHDALGVESGEQLEEARVLVADQRTGGQPDLVEDELELLLRRLELHFYDGAGEAGGVAVDDEQAGLEAAGPGVLGAADDEGGVGDVHAGDEDLAAGEDPLLAVAAGGGGDAVGVGARIGLGDAEGHGAAAVGEAGEPGPLLGLGAEAGDDRAADGG
ncbi:hypothetical protein GCM10020254_47950 [Streptomyces goshikiensis]